MPANWYLPSSATATLTVGVPRGEIGDFRVPPAAEKGDIIGSATEPLAISVRNVGSLAGRISLRIRDLDGATIWTGSITLTVDEGGWVYPVTNYPMPARDLRLRTEAYHDAVVDSYFDRTVVLILVVETAISLELVPAAVAPGATYSYRGALTRIDTGAGLAGMEVIARRYDEATARWVDIGTGTTRSDGSYDVAATAPTATGTFNCMVVFPGVVPFAATYARVELGVGIIPIPLMWMVAAASVGAGLLVAGSL